MKRALALAKRGRTSPNPMVGAVVVKDGRIVGEGYHKKAGDDHAEVVALKKSGELARGAVLYVTLEPCCHYGKTPPCTKAVISSGIAEVIAAMVDPNPKVAGNGLTELEKAGIKTSVGLLEDQAVKLNEAYIKYVTTGLPFVILKLALTLDGKIATRTGDSKWISCERSRRLVHRMRERSDAILVGSGTVVADNPSLTARINNRTSYPVRIIVDSKARTPVDSNVLRQPGDTIIATTSLASEENLRKLKQAGARIIIRDGVDGRVDLRGLMAELGSMSITNLLIEGGGEIAAGALTSRIVDKLVLFIAPKIAGGQSAVNAVGGQGVLRMADAIQLKDVKIKKVECDLLVEAYPCLQD